MDINEFIKKFTAQLEDEPAEPITPETPFRQLPEWDSMTGLAIISMVDKVYNKQLTGDDLKNSATISDLFNTIASR